VNGPVRSVEVESIEWKVGNDPFGDLAHVLVFDEEIAGRAAAPAHKRSPWPVLAGGMLIELRRDPALDVARQLG